MVVMDLVTEVLGMVGREDVREVEGGTGDRVGEVGGEGGVDCELIEGSRAPSVDIWDVYNTMFRLGYVFVEYPNPCQSLDNTMASYNSMFRPIICRRRTVLQNHVRV